MCVFVVLETCPKDNGGYLMKRRSVTQPWTCVHGGTSGTLVALMEGRTLVTANVGDSSALLAMNGRRLEVTEGENYYAGLYSIHNPIRAHTGFACRRLFLSVDHASARVGGGGDKCLA